MKKISFLYVLLVCAITYFLLFIGVPYFLQDPDLFSGFGALVPVIGFVMVWGIIFVYFIVRKLTSKIARVENNGHSFGISLGVVLILMIICWYWLSR